MELVELRPYPLVPQLVEEISEDQEPVGDAVVEVTHSELLEIHVTPIYK